MWPYGNKKEDVKPAEPDWKTKLIDEMKAWRKIGQKFNYLGRECVVTEYSEMKMIGMAFYIDVGIRANYADNLGVIHNISFSASESRALMANEP